jgi:UDP-N-acetylglucosamine 2-epimerase
VFLTDPVGYLDSIHLIKNAIAVITDSGGVLQEAHFAQTPYVFVLDIPCVPKNTRFDVSRLAKPERYDILAKLNTPQRFASDKKPQMQAVAQNIAAFEENVLKILREFEEMGIH